MDRLYRASTKYVAVCSFHVGTLRDIVIHENIDSMLEESMQGFLRVQWTSITENSAYIERKNKDVRG